MKGKILFTILLMISLAAHGQRQEVAQIKTPHGNILVWLYDETPNHKASFLQLARAGYWDSLSFNRVIPNFVAQGGCPDTPAGFKDSAYLLEPEFVPGIMHEYGSLGAGRDDNPGMLSARCQFYIVQHKDGLPRLDNKYTVYGKVMKGMDVVDKIVNLPRDKNDQPLQAVTMDVNIINMCKKRVDRLRNN